MQSFVRTSKVNYFLYLFKTLGDKDTNMYN